MYGTTVGWTPRRVGWATIFGVVFGVVCALGCPSAPPPVQSLRAAVEGNLAQQGLAAQRIACGEVTQGVAACEAVVDGTVVAFDVLVDDVLRVRPRDPTLRVAEVQRQVAAKLAALGHEIAELHCEGTVWLARAGSTGRCVMTDAQGQTWEYLATFTGHGARHRATIEAR